MSEEEIYTMFRDAVREVDDDGGIDDDVGITGSTEIAQLGLDSVMTMEVIGVLEDRLNVRFPDEDLANLNRMSDLTELIRKVS